LPCGSKSTTNTLRLFSPSAAERLMAVVDFPTPPFWLMIAMTCVGFSLLKRFLSWYPKSAPFRLHSLAVQGLSYLLRRPAMAPPSSLQRFSVSRETRIYLQAFNRCRSSTNGRSSRCLSIMFHMKHCLIHLSWCASMQLNELLIFLHVPRETET